jgi:hypothetical protein
LLPITAQETNIRSAISGKSEPFITGQQSEELPRPPIQFESHLNVTDLQRSMDFLGQTLGLELVTPVTKNSQCNFD